VFTGTTTVAGELYDPKKVFSKSSAELVALFDTQEKARIKKFLEETNFDTKGISRRARVAIQLLQYALLLLSITAIVVFAGM
jgi:hypothetical protein